MKKNEKLKNKSFLSKTFFLLKRYSIVVIILFIFLFLFLCDNLGTKTGATIINDLRSIATTFTPTTDLFDDGSEVSFVSYFFGMKGGAKSEKASFCYPSMQENISKTDDYLMYKCTGTVKSVCAGSVRAVGFSSNGEKYIEIEHPEGYLSRYVGINYVGVTAGQRVDKGFPIATSSETNSYKVYIHQNGNLIRASEISWEG